MASKKLTAYLNIDAASVLRMHLAEHPELKSDSAAVNDILLRFGRLSKASDKQDHATLQQLMDVVREHHNGSSQLLSLMLRMYALSIEVANATDANLFAKAEARAKQLYRQLKD